MSQYSTGLSSTTNGSPTVTGTNTLWLANVTAGDSFTVAGDGVMYDVASVDTDTQVTLSVAYAGVTASGAVYAIGTGFTVPDSFPEMSQGDIETATIFTRAMRKIQGKFNSLIDQAALANAQIFMSVAGGITGTSSGEFFFAVSGTSYTLYINDNGEEVEQVKFATFAEVYDLKVLAAASAEAASTSETNASDSADDSANSKSLADDARDITLGYRDETKAYRDDAVAVVTGGTATLEPEAGKIPLADAEGVIDSAWLGQYDPGIKQRREDLLKQATLSLDFANNKYEVYEGPVNSLTQMPFNEALDFTRASSATARTATGKIQEVLTDEQRLVGNREGLLIEEQRTNLHTHSQEFTNTATWGLSSLVAEDNSYKAPDGTLTAAELIAETSSGYLITTPNIIATPPGVLYVASIWVNNVPAGTEVMAVNENGSAVLAGVTLPVDVTEWTRVSVPYTADATGFSRMQVKPNVAGVAFRVWGAQIEAGSTPSSYIPTAGAQVTRAADNCVRVLGQEFNPDEGTLFVEAYAPDTDVFGFTAIVGTLSNQRISAYFTNGTARAQVRGVVSVTEVTKNVVPGELVKFAIAYNNNTSRNFASINAVSGVLTNSFLSAGSDLHVGKQSKDSKYLSVPLARIKLYPTALSDAKLITLTGGT